MSAYWERTKTDCTFMTTFPHKRGSFALSVDVFKKIHQKLKSPNVYEM